MRLFLTVMLSTLFIVCFGAGFCFAVISFIFGEIFHAFQIDGDGPGAFSGSVLAAFLMGITPIMGLALAFCGVAIARLATR